MRLLLFYMIVFSFYSCKKRDEIFISKKEYESRKREGFWEIRNKKAISYNQNVAKPKRDRQMKKLARENKQIMKSNSRNEKKFQDNETLHKIFEHH